MTSGSESMGQEPRSASCSSTSNDSSNFECNICFDLAQDPIVTLCGHLFCWPCLYKWLQTRTQSQVCPVCNALIEEEKLVPLYGRGKTSTDPRSKSIPGSSIPHRPAGQRPQTAPTPEPNYFPDHSFGLMGGFDGFAPQTMPRFGNFASPAAFGRFMPSLFNLHEHGFHNRAFFGVGTGYPHGFYSSFYGDHARVYYQRRRQQQQDAFLKKLLIGIGLCVLLVILFN